MCDCFGRGSILAWDKQALDAGPFAFKCCGTKNFPSWETRDKTRWVALSEDPEGLTPQWVLSEVEAGRADSDAFKEKLRIWDREFVLSVWRQAANEKAAEQARLAKAEREKKNEK